MPAIINAPRGTKDVLPSEVYKWHYLEGIARGTAHDFGYSELRFPTFEHTELFVRGVGDTTDVVQKEMYTFNDKGGRSISLRPEGTASVVRSYLENSIYAAGLPAKMYYVIPNFRYEKPQAGRLREHHQFGVECFGAEGPEADAEVISLGAEYLRRLGIKSYVLEINSIGCPNCRPAFHEALRGYFRDRQGELCDTCRDRLERNPMRILDCKSDVCQGLSQNAPVGLDYLCGECRDHLAKVCSYLDSIKLKYTVNPRIVRGLDYYTRTVFEFISVPIGNLTVIGGGRYDGLVSSLGGQPTPALGFGSGIERMLLAMEAEGVVIPPPNPVRVFVASQSPDANKAVQILVQGLRAAHISAESDLLGRSLKAQMKYAGKSGAEFTVVIGGYELETGIIKVKNMTTGEQSECALNPEAVAAIVR
jgi:histidyl-tRNA synthetase